MGVRTSLRGSYRELRRWDPVYQASLGIAVFNVFATLGIAIATGWLWWLWFMVLWIALGGAVLYINY